MGKIFCSHAQKLYKHCYDNKILCNVVEREGISYLDCRYAVKPNGVFKVTIECGICGSKDVEMDTITYTECSDIIYKCNNCGNKTL